MDCRVSVQQSNTECRLQSPATCSRAVSRLHYSFGRKPRRRPDRSPEATLCPLLFD